MKYLRILIGIIISLVALWFALQGISFNQVGGFFGQLNWWFLLASLVPFFGAMALRVTRWQLLFWPETSIRLSRLWSSLMIGYLFNTILPARLGEIVRTYTLSRTEKIGPVRVFSTILLEKILDVMMLFIFMLALLPTLSNLDNDIRQAAFVIGGVVVVIFAICLLMAYFRQRATRFIDWVLKLLPLPANWRLKIANLASEVLDVLVILLNPRLSFNLWAQTFLLWTLIVVNNLLVCLAFGVPFNFQLALLLTVTLNLGMTVPSAPGYIGVFEALVKASLLPFFPDQESLLLSMGLLLHIQGYLPVIILGAVCTLREGLNLSSGKTMQASLKQKEDAKLVV